MRRPVILDLFCGAGGAAKGYYEAGFDIVGIDVNPQPNYPYRFWQRDALTLPCWVLGSFDAIHASPPCQAYTRARRLQGREHPDLIPRVRELLRDAGVPYVIENVPGAPLEDYVVLCGTSFGLGTSGFELRRHRWFECSFSVMVPPCHHELPAVQIMGHGTNAWFRTKYPDAVIGNDERREALGVPWMVWDEIGDAVPPAFTAFIGAELLRQWDTWGDEALDHVGGALAGNGEARTAPAVPEHPQGHAEPTSDTRGAA